MAEAADFSMPDAFAKDYLDRIIKKTEKSLNNTCILYTGRKAKSGYTVVDVRLPGPSHFVPMNVHRLRYMIHTRCIQLNPENYHISHLCQCHTKTCVNISHLSLEPPHVNNSRQNCLSQQCFSHCHLKGFWLFEYNLVIILRKCRVQNVFTYVLSFSMIIS